MGKGGVDADEENRFVMQDTKDPRAFTIVERYAHESVSVSLLLQTHRHLTN